ncbi:MAG: YunG family protein [Nocardioidaceae bacterium]
MHVDGTKVGNHYWNRLSDGTEVDLTAEQFLPEEVVVNGHVVARPPDAPRRHREQYELLRDRVMTGLARVTAVRAELNDVPCADRGPLQTARMQKAVSDSASLTRVGHRPSCR